MNTIKEIVRDHYKYRRQLMKLAKSDIIKTYKGSALGWSWAIIKPAITLFVYWFAFSVGLKATNNINGYPFFIWLLVGMVPWFYMRDMIIGGAGALRKYSYLVTKIKFPISTIPTFVNISILTINLALHGIMIAIYLISGYGLDLYCLQIPLYFFAMALFFNLWGIFASLLAAVSKDFLNLIKSIILALFWISGIMYDVNKIDITWIKEIMLWNPITIIVNGYRNSLVYKQWFWEAPLELVRLGVMFIIMFALATVIYKKLKKDVPDVL